MDKDREKNWLIKSSSKILGPFTAVEVAQLLVKKHISIIDEVRSPSGRWTYIRETGIFSEVVQNLRKEQAANAEETASSMTQTISKTAEVSTPRPDMTPTPLLVETHKVSTPPSKEEDEILETISVKDVTPLVDQTPASQTERSFGSESDDRLQRSIREENKGVNVILWSVVGFLVLSVGFFMFNKFREPGVDQKKLVEKALRYKHLHLYNKALEAYKKAQAIKEPDLKTSFEMGLVLIQLERQSLSTRRIFVNGLSDPGITPEQRVDAFIGIGLSYMLENDLKMAHDYYQKALSFDPNNVPAQLNIAFNEMKKGDLVKASDIIKRLPPTAKFEYAHNLAKAALVAETKRTRANDEIIRELTTYIKEVRPWQKEIALLVAYAFYLDKNFAAFNDVVKIIVDMPIAQSKDFAVDLRIDPSFAEWEYLDKFCSEIYSQAPVSGWTRSLRLVCYLEQDREGEAQKLINEALAQNPNEPSVLLMQAQALYKSGRYQEASSVLKSPHVASFKTTPLLLGRMCRIIGETTCAEQNLDRAMKAGRENLAVLAEYASLKLESKPGISHQVIAEGLQREELYKPLIELREKAESP